jgi:hypothetical protein
MKNYARLTTGIVAGLRRSGERETKRQQSTRIDFALSNISHANAWEEAKND